VKAYKRPLSLSPPPTPDNEYVANSEDIELNETVENRDFDGGKYTGDWKNDKPHGKGKINYYVETVRKVDYYDYYEGNWENGMRNGEGISRHWTSIRSKNQREKFITNCMDYDGNWENDKPTNGIIKYIDVEYVKSNPKEKIIKIYSDGKFDFEKPNFVYPNIDTNATMTYLTDGKQSGVFTGFFSNCDSFYIMRSNGKMKYPYPKYPFEGNFVNDKPDRGKPIHEPDQYTVKTGGTRKNINNKHKKKYSKKNKKHRKLTKCKNKKCKRKTIKKMY
jgi:hypothetical protein